MYIFMTRSTITSVIRGLHVYKSVWRPQGEVCHSVQKKDNPHVVLVMVINPDTQGVLILEQLVQEENH